MESERCRNRLRSSALQCFLLLHPDMPAGGCGWMEFGVNPLACAFLPRSFIVSRFVFPVPISPSLERVMVNGLDDDAMDVSCTLSRVPSNWVVQHYFCTSVSRYPRRRDIRNTTKQWAGRAGKFFASSRHGVSSLFCTSPMIGFSTRS